MSLSAQPSRTLAGLDVVVGDPAAFRDWYDAAMPRVYRYLAARAGGDAALAGELTQATFVADDPASQGCADAQADVTEAEESVFFCRQQFAVTAVPVVPGP